MRFSKAARGGHVIGEWRCTVLSGRGRHDLFGRSRRTNACGRAIGAPKASLSLFINGLRPKRGVFRDIP